MKWIRFCSAVVALVGLSGTADAGLFGFLNKHDDCGASKSCGCASDCQPTCCKPTIVRPCETSVHTYQRRCSDIKPPCCDTCCPSSCCAPAEAACCAPAATSCAPSCAPAPTSCAPSCAPAAPECCAPAAPECCAPAGCGPAGCGDACGTACGCEADPCEIAQLIYDSQTACYAKDRKKAIHKLGDKFSCVCNPEIMCAFIYALNDADEDVRAKAADEIGDQLRKNPCCCSAELVQALTCALADCDRSVRRQAEEALEACGYEIIDGCCDTCGVDQCGPAGCGPAGCGPAGCGPVESAPTSAPAPAPVDEDAAPAPAPPEDKDAYFPSRLRQQKQSYRAKSRSGLAGLFGLLD